MKWKFSPNDGDSILASPAIGADGTIYVASDDSNLYAINPANGIKKWTFNVGTFVNSSPAIGSDGTIYFGAADGKLYAICQGTAFTVTPLADANGSISPSTPQTVYSNCSIAFTAKPNPGYAVANWTVDGAAAQTGGTQFALTNIWANHTVDVTFSQLPPLSISKIVSSSSAAVGGKVIYSINFAIYGVPKTGVTVTDVLPANVTYVTGSASRSGVYSASTNTITWSLGNLAAGASGTLTFQATLNSGVSDGTVVSNTATISCNELSSPVQSNAASFKVFSSAEAAGRGDWWMFRHDPFHTGRSQFSGTSAPAQKWKVSIGSPPAIGVDGTIYTGGSGVRAINPDDGSNRWTVMSDISFPVSPAIGADGTIYIAGNNNLYAINPVDGSQKWVSALASTSYSSPAIGVDGTIYVGSGDNKLYAINPADGSQKWAFNTGGSINSSPAIGENGTIYVSSGDYNLYAINPDGSQKWGFTASAIISSSPAIGVDGTIYIISNNLYLYAINPADGSQKWASNIGVATSFVSLPAIGADGTIYVGAGDYNLYAINPANGSQKWAFTVTGMYKCAVEAIGADGTLYVNSGGGLYALSQRICCTVTPSAGANGSINPNTPQAVASGYSITFTATPNIGYQVDSWSVDGQVVQTGGWTYNLSNVTANHSVLVTFKSIAYTVTPSAGANGSISPNTPQTVNYGSSITFTATPNTGYAVANWAVDNAPVQTGGTQFTLSNVTTNHTVRVTFKTATYTVTPSAGANGSISPNTVQTVDYGGSLTFTATPNTGYHILNWSVDGSLAQTGGTSFTLSNITANHTVLVTFSINPYTVTPSSGANGTISPSTPQTVNYGDNLTFTATPGFQYAVDQWYLDGTSVQTGGTTYTLNNISANHIVVVTFRPGPGDWWMFHHDIQHTGRSPFTGPSTPILKWTSTTGANIYSSSPAMGGDGTIYIGSYDDKLYAINPDDGWQKWVLTTGGWIDSSPAIGADGTIYIGSNDGNLYAMDMATGIKKWTFDTGGPIDTSPTIGPDGTIYIGSGDEYLYAVNPNGSQKWNFFTKFAIYSSPAIGADGTIYFGDDGFKLRALNPANGSEIWAFTATAEIRSSPAIGSDGTIYVGSDDGKLYAINPFNGTKRWEFDTGGWIDSSPAIGSDGTIYFGSKWDGKVYALNPMDGTKKWAFTTGGWIDSSPAIGSDGTIYIGSWDNKLYAVNPTDGTKKWAYSTGASIISSPAIGAGGTIYIGSEDGKLYAIGRSAPSGILLAGIAADGSVWHTNDMASWTSVPGKLASVATGDFNGDGNCDLVGLATDSTIWYTIDKSSWTNVPGRLKTLAVGNFDGSGKDGIVGLALDNSIWYTADMSAWQNVPGYLSSLDCDDFAGSGVYGIIGIAGDSSVWYTSNMSTWQNIPGKLSALASGDFNRDGKAEIAGKASDGSIWYSTNMTGWTQIPGTLSSIVTGDFTGIGQAGVAGLASDNSIWYTMNLQNWTQIPGKLQSLVVGDFNSDGKADLAGLAQDGSIWYTTNLQTWTNVPGRLSMIVPGRP